MPFLESSDSIKSKMHISNVSNPIIVGILALVIVSLLLLGQNIFHMLDGGSFSVSKESGGMSSEDKNRQSDDPQKPSELDKETSENPDGANLEEAKSTPASQVVVFVSGAVAKPAVYTLPEGSRVNDAIVAAGGFADGAATDSVNLARVLQDGEQIAIQTKEEAQASSNQTSNKDASSESFEEAQNSSNSLVNINTASSAELISLPGIGEATAAKIIANRESEGQFASKEDLMRVSGIGEKKFAAISELICV